MRQMRTTGETALYPKLIKLPIIEGSKFRRQSAKSPDQPELSGSDVNDKPKPRFLRKCERILGFTLHINERVACREKIRDQVAAAVGRAIEVAHLVRRLQRAAQKITPSPDMSRPRQDETSEAHIGPGLAGRIEIRQGSRRSAVRRPCQTERRRSTSRHSCRPRG